MQNKQIILASASPRRKELLELMGLEFTILPSRAEERITGETPAQIVENLSHQKAEDVAERYRADEAIRSGGAVLIIGSDTIVVCEGEIMGKPASEADAFRMLEQLQGRTHEVYTGVTLLLLEGDKITRDTFSKKTSVTVHAMEEQEIRAYISRGESMDKAGAYGIQGSFAMFVDEIRGEYSTVLGLPVAGLYQALKKLSVMEKP